MKAETQIAIVSIGSILLIVIVTLTPIILGSNNKYKKQIESLQRQLKACQEIPAPKCESLEDRIKWCESKIMNHADAINALLQRPNGLD